MCRKLYNNSEGRNTASVITEDKEQELHKD